MLRRSAVRGKRVLGRRVHRWAGTGGQAGAAQYASASDLESVTLSAPPSKQVEGGAGKLFTQQKK